MPDFFDTDLGPHILGKEGGYVNDPSDSGGETIWGMTVGTARELGYKGPMRDMTRETALGLYRLKFYERSGIVRLAVIDRDVCREVFDTAVNLGEDRAIRFLQRVVNVSNRNGADWPDIGVDGKLGPGTATATASMVRVRGANEILKRLNCLQGAFYIELAERREKDERFVNGWFANRVLL